MNQLIFFRLEVDCTLQDVAQVTQWTSFLFFSKLVTDKGIKAEATSAEKDLVVGNPVINGAAIAAEDDLKCFLCIHRDIKLPGQSVSGAEGDDAQRGVAVDQCSGHFVDRAVTTCCEHIPVLFLHRLLGYFSCMSGVSGDADHQFEFLLVVGGGNHLGDAFLRLCPGDGIDDQADLFFFHDEKMFRCKRPIDTFCFNPFYLSFPALLRTFAPIKKI